MRRARDAKELDIALQLASLNSARIARPGDLPLELELGAARGSNNHRVATARDGGAATPLLAKHHREGKDLEDAVLARKVILKVNRSFSSFQRLAGTKFPTARWKPSGEVDFFSIDDSRCRRDEVASGTLQRLAFQHRHHQESIQAIGKDRPCQRQQILRDRMISLYFPNPLSQPNSLSVFCNSNWKPSPLPTLAPRAFLSSSPRPPWGRGAGGEEAAPHARLPFQPSHSKQNRSIPTPNRTTTGG